MSATMVPRRFAVTERIQDTADTSTIRLEPVDGGPLGFSPGQFTMLGAFGIGEVPISISGDPGRPGVLQHTIRDVGAVSAALMRAAPGTVLGVRGPFGTGWGVSDARGGDVVIMAGGIGLAPLRPAVLEICENRSAFGQAALLYGARTPADLLYVAELTAWAERFDVQVAITVDAADATWRGRVGLVTELIPRVRFDPGRALALLCGPEVMMRHSARALVGSGIPPRRVRLSMERNMQCGIGLCGHCQLRELFVCVDGPVLGFDTVTPLMSEAEL